MPRLYSNLITSLKLKLRFPKTPCGNKKSRWKQPCHFHLSTFSTLPSKTNLNLVLIFGF
jgi:hypothetical protein